MTSVVAKYISKKVLGETLKNNFGSDDPYFEQVPATRLDGRPSNKTKKQRKALPPGISEHDGKILTKVKRRAYRLDMSLFNCCGIRFGWSSVIGIIPGIGDVIDLYMAVMVLRTCQQVEGGLPKDVQSKMISIIFIDFLIGITPLIGDVMDGMFKANTRNAVELEKFLRKKGAAQLKARGHRVPDVDPSDPDEHDRLMHEKHGAPPGYTPSLPMKRGTQQQGLNDVSNSKRLPTEPPPVRVPENRQNKGSWFGFGGKSRQYDVEQADDQPSQPARLQSTLQKDRGT